MAKKQQSKSILTDKTIKTVEAAANAGDFKGIQALQKAANTTVARGFNQYQAVLCAVILHVAKHRDTTVVTKMLEGVPDGMRKVSMKDFMQTFGTFDFAEDGSVVLVKTKKLKLGEALESPWQSFGGKEEKAFDLHASIQSLIKRAEKRQKEGLKEGDKLDEAELAMLKAVAHRMDKPETVVSAVAV